jgi:hypothetical protein
MRVARFWAFGSTSATAPDGEEVHRSIWRGSDQSEAAAQAEVDRALARVEQSIRAGTAEGWYAYADSTRPEPLVEEMQDEHGVRIAAVTIGRFGATILNTTLVPFVDVDLGGPKRSGRLFGRKKQVDPAEEKIGLLQGWVAERSGRSARIYRTAAGLRYLLPSMQMDPTSQETHELMERLGADPLYAKLCRAQGCYRARLSPKPWRLGVGGPPGHIKYGRDAATFLDWNEAYTNACANHAVCELVTTIGEAPPTADAAHVIDLHDAATGVGSGLPLA